MSLREMFQPLSGWREGAEKNRLSYIEYIDSGGNHLRPEDILFTDEQNFRGKQTLEIWGQNEESVKTYTIDSEDVELLFDESGNFPVALKTKDGKIMYLKVSAKTGEVLPIHAGCCQVLSVIYTGAPRAGKTVNILQISSPAFHDMIAHNTGCSFEDDLPSEAPKRKRYENARTDMMENHILPGVTRRGDIMLPYVYYIQFADGDVIRRILLKVEDIDGQECVDMAWDSKIFPNNYYMLTIGADEIVAGERGETVLYTTVIDQLLPRLRVLRGDRDYEIIVMISKCDCLDSNHKDLKAAQQNSIALIDGKMYQTIHDEGFDYEVFNQRSDCIKAFLKEECPNFYNKLVNAIPKQNLTFCMIASIGEECKNNHFTNYLPFCIDEPILSVLTKAGMYPIAVNQEGPEEEDVPGFTKKRWSLKRSVKWLVEAMKIDDSDDDYDEYEAYEPYETSEKYDEEA